MHELLVNLGWKQRATRLDSRRAARPSHLAQGPVILSWVAAVTCLTLQATFTNSDQIAQDGASLWALLCQCLPADVEVILLGWGAEHAAAQLLVLYATLWLTTVGSSFFMMPSTFPATQQSEPDEHGVRAPVVVPPRKQSNQQHQLNAVDYTYITLNTFCMPGLFYHFITLMRSWGLDFGAPPLFGIYPPSAQELLLQTLPTGACTLALYFVTYEFIYYWWHRAMHEHATLYTYVHKHHHQVEYPDRAALDTLNTGCVESQVGLYLQLATLWSFGQLGLAHLPAAIWFFTIAGYLSVLEHDKFERALPFDVFRADDHHMHHSFVRCNYSPYSSLWDRVFGTFKPFAVVQPKQSNAASVAEMVKKPIEMPPTLAIGPTVVDLSAPSLEAEGGVAGKEPTGPRAMQADELQKMSDRIWRQFHDRARKTELAMHLVADPAQELTIFKASEQMPKDRAGKNEGDAQPSTARAPSSNNRANGYCDDDDGACRLIDQIEITLNSDRAIRMRGLAVGYASTFATLLFIAAMIKRPAW